MYQNQAGDAMTMKQAAQRQLQGTVGGCALVGAQIAPREVPEVEREVNRLQATINMLDDTVGLMTQRLSSGGVMLPPSPNKEASGVEPTCGSQLGTQLQVARNRIDGINSQVRSLIDSLAV